MRETKAHHLRQSFIPEEKLRLKEIVCEGDRDCEESDRDLTNFIRDREGESSLSACLVKMGYLVY